VARYVIGLTLHPLSSGLQQKTLQLFKYSARLAIEAKPPMNDKRKPMEKQQASKIPLAAYAKAAFIYNHLSKPVTTYILRCLEQEERTAPQMVNATYSHRLILSSLKVLHNLGLVRQEKLGNDTNWKLIHGKLELFNNTAARLL